MNKYSIIFLLILTTSYSGWTQQEKLIGTWIKTKIEALDGQYSDAGLMQDATFLKYTFLNDGTIYISTSPDAYGDEDRYFLEANGVIVFHYFSMQIESLTENDMVLIQLDNFKIPDNATKVHFVREEEYLRRQQFYPNEYAVRDNDTIYKSGEKAYVTFKDKSTNFWGFLRDNLEEVVPPKKAEFALATFVVNADATVDNVEIWHHVSQKYDDKIKTLIKQTSNGWITHPINGKGVKVWKPFYIKLNVLKKVRITESLTLTTIDETKKFPQDYFSQYVQAIFLIDEGLWSDAISVLLNCIGLTKNPLNVYYQLSICYGHVNNPELEQFYSDQLKKTPLAYLISQK
ncbi:MAG: hypothetical protein PSV16_10715 [Flavobacterium sp.]|nr:hypothetical protein [Flavobacterium sp.]